MVFGDGFVRREFACNCNYNCGLDTIDAETLEVITLVRKWAGTEVIIRSGHRCKKHNKDVGGKPGSYHLKARACDIVVVRKTPKEVADFLEEKFPNKYGIGRYESFTHIDTRELRARWGTTL